MNRTQSRVKLSAGLPKQQPANSKSKKATTEALAPAQLGHSGQSSALQRTPSWEHKLAFTIHEVKVIASCSNGYLYKAISEGQLRAVKRGRRTLVLRADLDAWLNAFPAIQPKQPAA